MISQKAKHALRALVALAQAGNSLMIGDIAERHNIPRKFLEQILLDLKRHGIVQSWRGRAGGYALFRPADQITFGEVLRIVDGALAPLACLSRTQYRRCLDCRDEKSCEIRRVFATVADSVRQVLDRTTIADAAAGRVPYPISGDDRQRSRKPVPV
jgi:Rrf2 family protein